MSKRGNRIKYVLTAVWCAGILVLGGCSDRNEGTWKSEYEKIMAVMERKHSCRGVSAANAKTGRRYPYKCPVMENTGFLERGNTNPENSVPEEMIQALSTALQNNTLEEYLAEISAEYALLSEDEIKRYVRKDSNGILESFYIEYMEGGGEWFLFGRDNDIIVRQKTDQEEYPYCYYKFSCQDERYGSALRAYGKNEDYFFISWEDDDYLVVTKRADGQVNGIAVYQMHGYTFIGWILGLEKTSGGGVEKTFYTYVSNGNYIQGTFFLDY